MSHPASKKIVNLLNTALGMNKLKLHSLRWGKQRQLTVFLDKNQGKITILDLEAFSKSFLFLLRAEGLENLSFEASSPGVNKAKRTKNK